MARSKMVWLSVLGTGLAVGGGFGCSSTSDTPTGETTVGNGGTDGGGNTGGGGSVGSGGTNDAATATGGGAGVDLDSSTPVDRVIPTDGPPGDHCYGLDVVAPSLPGLIADFEGGSKGEWALQGDKTCTLTPVPLVPETPIAGKTVNDTSKYALHVTGSGCASTGFSTGLAFNGYAGPSGSVYMCAYDVSAYDGIYFWAFGDAIDVNVTIRLRTTVPASNGGDGSCAQNTSDKGCWDDFISPVTLSADWKLYKVAWTDLAQGGWGTKTPWNAKIVVGLAFAVTYDQTTQTPASIWLDNVGFYKGTPPPAHP